MACLKAGMSREGKYSDPYSYSFTTKWLARNSSAGRGVLKHCYNPRLGLEKLAKRHDLPIKEVKY